MKSERAVLYCRVSSKEQEEEGFSLDAQERTGRDYAGRRGLEIVREYKVSESAWSAGRDKFNQMVDFLKRHGEVGHVISDCPDRMTRNDFDKLKIFELIKSHGKTIHFARNNKTIDANSGSDDEFLFDIEIAVAKKWSNDISRKASMGMREKASQGLYPGRAPLGYLNDHVGGPIKIDLERVPLVVKVFEIMASGQCSLSMLVDRMARLGLRTRGGHKVQKSSLEQMLKNPFYCGTIIWAGQRYPGKHDPLISKSLFDTANAVLSGRNISAKPRMNGFLFNNLTECGLCGCGVIGEKKKAQYVYYHCTYSKGRHHGVPYLSEAAFVGLFDGCVERVTVSNDCLHWLEDVLVDSLGDHVRLTESRAAALSKQKAMLDARLSRLYDSLCDGVIPAEAFNRKESEYKAELADLTAALAECNRDQQVESHEGLQILELANRLYPTYLDMEHEKRAKLLKLLASNYVLDGVTLSATYRKSFSLFRELPSRPSKRPRLDSNQRPAD